jgi:hypothetical protein
MINANSLLLLELAKRSVGDEHAIYFDLGNQALSSVSTYHCGKQGLNYRPRMAE